MITFRQPFRNEWAITQRYGEKITSSFHTGIDYGCPFGTPILASADGEVKYAQWNVSGYGNVVIIQHSSDRSTLYAHLSDISVTVGKYVRQGELIGHSGNTGNSTGPHLHFEARTKWNHAATHFDPLDLPLMSVDDNPVAKPSESQETGLLKAEDLKKGPVMISCSAGAYGHNANFSDKTVYPYGTKLNFTGNVKNRGAYEFCECELKMWVAVNDGETQILMNTEEE